MKKQTKTFILVGGGLCLLIAAALFLVNILDVSVAPKNKAEAKPVPSPTSAPVPEATAILNPIPTATATTPPLPSATPAATPAPITTSPVSTETQLSSNSVDSPQPSSREVTGEVTPKEKGPVEAGLVVLPPDLSRSGGRWIDVNLKDGYTRLMDDQKIIKELPSSWGYGIPGTDTDFYSTPPDVYYVYEKRDTLQYDTLFGTGYFRGWVGFDPERLNGFHSFIMDASEKIIDPRLGPVSHGCVRVEDWQSVYNFAEVGMPVVVHGEAPQPAQSTKS